MFFYEKELLVLLFSFYHLSVKSDFCVKMEQVKHFFAEVIEGNMLTSTYRPNL